MLTQPVNSSTEICSFSCTVIPSHLQLSDPSSHPWYTDCYGEAVALKKKLAFFSWKANPTEGNLTAFQKACNKCVSTFRRATKQHLSNLKNTFKRLSLPPQRPDGALLSLSLVYSVLPFHPFPLFNWHHGRILSWKGRMPQFCVCFQIFSPSPQSRYTSFPDESNCSWIVSFAPEKVEKVLSILDFDSATGSDGNSSRVLKTCSAALAHPLSALFTISFVPSHLISAWKSANINALLNKGAKTDPLNHRPISLLSIISKVMESVIAVDMKSFSISPSTSSQITSLVSDKVTPPWSCCFYSPNNG